MEGWSWVRGMYVLGVVRRSGDSSPFDDSEG